jgi:chromosome segregation ATPase
MQLPDQADLLARLQAAEAQRTALTTELATLKTDQEASSALLLEAQDTIKRLEGEREAALARAQQAEAAAVAARALTERAVAEKAAAEAQLTDFNARVAAEVQRLGLARTPAPSDAAAGKREEDLTPTEKVLRAKGVSSLAELSQSPQN